MAPTSASVYDPIPKLVRLRSQARITNPAPIAVNRSRGLNFSQICMDLASLAGTSSQLQRSLPVARSVLSRATPVHLFQRERATRSAAILGR
jgi:hypothetical protein